MRPQQTRSQRPTQLLADAALKKQRKYDPQAITNFNEAVRKWREKKRKF